METQTASSPVKAVQETEKKKRRKRQLFPNKDFLHLQLKQLLDQVLTEDGIDPKVRRDLTTAKDTCWSVFLEEQGKEKKE